MPTIEAKPVTITFDSTLSAAGLRALADRLLAIGESIDSVSHGIAMESLARAVNGAASKAEVLEKMDDSDDVFAAADVARCAPSIANLLA